MRNEWGIASICDIVLNHTANESEWLLENPETAYSCFTMPHLRPAFLLDVVFSSISNDAAAGNLENVGVPKLIETDDDIQVSIVFEFPCEMFLIDENFVFCRLCDINCTRFICRKQNSVNSINATQRNMCRISMRKFDWAKSPVQAIHPFCWTNWRSFKIRNTSVWAQQSILIWHWPNTTSTGNNYFDSLFEWN